MTDAFVRALMLGCGRSMPSPPAGMASVADARPDSWLLPTIALLGQQSRHRRAEVPSLEPDAGLPPDDRQVVGDAARTILLQLFAERSGSAALPPDCAAVAVRAVMRQRGLRLHPFDLPRLTKLLPQKVELQEPQERAWLQRVHRAESDTGAAEVGASETGSSLQDLELAPTSVQVDHLRHERVRDPAQARGQLEALLVGRSAAIRARLIETLAVRLGPDDRDLLEAQIGGRAKSVAEVAESLLARLPGTEQHEQRIDAVARSLETGKSGLLRRKRSFAWQKLHRREDRVHVAVDACAGIDLGSLATRLDCTVEELCTGSSNDPALATGLAVAALLSGRPDAVELVARCESFDWHGLLYAIREHPQRGEWVRELTAACLQPESWAKLPSTAALEELAATVAGSLSDEVGRELLTCASLQAALQKIAAKPMEAVERTALEPLAVLMPRAHRKAFRAAIEPIALADRQCAGQLLDLFDLLDEATS